MIGKIISHYKILERIGAGGMGVVYKAVDTKLGRLVALKFLPPYAMDSEEDRTRFLNEAQAAAALDHPNLCVIHEISEADGHQFIAMAFIDGQGLKEIIAAGPLPVDKAVDIALQIAAGLASAHAHDIIHRDIKPANIMVSRNGVVKIVDFGLAKSSISKKLTRTGSAIGTAAYMSPEQARGEVVDKRTDIWSFGAVLYEMLAGQPPYFGPHEAMVIYAIMNEDFPPLNQVRQDIPPSLQHVVSRALTKDRNNRYADVGEMINDLRGVLDASATQVHVVPPRPPSPRPSPPDRQRSTTQEPAIKSKKYLIAGATGVIALAVVAGWLFLRRPMNSESQVGTSPADISPGSAALETTGSAPATTPETSASTPAATPETTLTTAAADTAMPIVAILPLSERGGGKGDDVFAIGMTEDIIAHLSNLHALRVLSRHEVLPYRGRSGSARTIGKALNAGYVMEGSVRRDQNQLHLTVQLNKVEDGTSVWTQTFDRDLKDIFQVQGEIARAIAGALSIELSPSEKKSLTQTSTTSLDAYDLCQKGSQLSDERSLDDNALAEKAFRKAIALDKNYAPAEIGLAQTYLRRIDWALDDDPKWLDEAESLLDQAAKIDPTAPELYLGYATMGRLRGASAKGVSAARRAVAARPNDHETHYVLAACLLSDRKWDEAGLELQKTIALRPEFPDAYSLWARLYAYGGKPDSADQAYSKAIDLAPNATHIHMEAARFYLQRGHFAQAESQARRAIELAPKASSSTGLLGVIELYQRKLSASIDHLKTVADETHETAYQRPLGWAYRLSGKRGPAEKALRNCLKSDKERLDADATNTDVAYLYLWDQVLLDSATACESELTRLAKKPLRTADPSFRAYQTAAIWAAAGKSDRAVASIREVLKYNVLSPIYVAADPAFENLKSVPQFKKLTGLK